jgi:hypothetical protein
MSDFACGPQRMMSRKCMGDESLISRRRKILGKILLIISNVSRCYGAGLVFVMGAYIVIGYQPVVFSVVYTFPVLVAGLLMAFGVSVGDMVFYPLAVLLAFVFIFVHSELIEKIITVYLVFGVVVVTTRRVICSNYYYYENVSVQRGDRKP